MLGSMRVISIHALHEESDRTMTPINPLARLFQSTLSMRRATIEIRIGAIAGQFQSTLSMRRATIEIRIGAIAGQFQSTLSMRRATVV